MADNRKVVLSEIGLWKKRFFDSRRVLGSVYKDVKKEAKKAYREAIK